MATLLLAFMIQLCLWCRWCPKSVTLWRRNQFSITNVCWCISIFQALKSSYWFSKSPPNTVECGKLLCSYISYCEVISWMCDLSTAIQPVIRTLLAELLCQPHFTWLSEAGMVKKISGLLAWGAHMQLLLCSWHNGGRNFSISFSGQNHSDQSEVFEKHSLSLPNAVTIVSKGNMNQKKEVKSSYNSIASL